MFDLITIIAENKDEMPLPESKATQENSGSTQIKIKCTLFMRKRNKMC